ncbi:MAG: DUF2202 domain-containing protein [Methanomicrobia archaeon]|nr:DUF2202 domain-containing protein [Methanomicrobia archaeon]
MMLGFYVWGGFQKTNDMTTVDESGSTSIDEPVLRSTIDQMPVEVLSDAEKAGILYMREEEKLAHDVYLTLYEQWNLPIFNNIARSEQTHTDAVKTLIDKYGLVDPATATIGSFSNPELQALYENLVNDGSISLQDALNVGAAVEEIDILDLQEYLAETDNEDITLVYENLMKGSRNHLRAFVSTLERQGYDYTPQYLSQEEFDAIVSSPLERGRS